MDPNSVLGQQRLIDQLMSGQLGSIPGIQDLLAMIGGVGSQRSSGGPIGGVSRGPGQIGAGSVRGTSADLLSSPYGRGWSARQQAYSGDSIQQLLNSLMGDLGGDGGAFIPDVPGLNAGNGGNGGNGGGGQGRSLATGVGNGGNGGGNGGGGGGGGGNPGPIQGGTPSAVPGYWYQPGELEASGMAAYGATDPFSPNFTLPASYPGDYEDFFWEQFGSQLEADPNTKIPSWAWKYAIDADGRGYPPGTYGQHADGSWSTPDGRGPSGEAQTAATTGGMAGWDGEVGNNPGFGNGVPGGGGDDGSGMPPNDHGPMPNTPGDVARPGPHAFSPHQNTGPGGGRDTGRGNGGNGVGGRGGRGGRDRDFGGRNRDRGGGGFQGPAQGIDVTGQVSPFGNAFAGGGGNAGRRDRDRGRNDFAGGGYAVPGQIDRELRRRDRENRRADNEVRTDWGDLSNRRMRDNGGVRVSDNGRRVRDENGNVTRQGKERTRERSRSGSGGSTTTITIDRSGGTQISNQSGGNGNRGRNAGNGGNNRERDRVVEQAQNAARQRRNDNGNNRRRDDDNDGGRNKKKRR